MKVTFMKKKPTFSGELFKIKRNCQIFSWLFNFFSDSDSTDCPTDFDTGQDGGDECDTDDLLDMDFIDKGNTHEVLDKGNWYKNTGACSYHPMALQVERKTTKLKKSKRSEENSKRRKRYVRTRKKQSESYASNASSINSSLNSVSRGCRSVGGTPVCLRRNQMREGGHSTVSPLSNRSNSLTFTEVYSIHSRMLALSDSEKALLKADLEADFKYKQLIHEAETILVSMKTNAFKEAPSTIQSPRRLCNFPTNKRVEMLRNDEVELKRELAKTLNQKSDDGLSPNEGVIVNKRLEILKHDSPSVPGSPRSGRNSPLKTHVSNFISQNVEPNVKKKTPPEPPPRRSILDLQNKSPQLPTRNLPTRSPAAERRRLRTQNQIIQFDSDSESEDVSRISNRSAARFQSKEKTGFISQATKTRIVTRSSKTNVEVMPPIDPPKAPLISFRSVDIGYSIPDVFYCPQSEPLKRKVYSCSSTYDRIQKKLDNESGKFYCPL